LTQAKEEAGRELGSIAHSLNDKDRGDFVLKHVIEMAHDDDNEDNRIVAVQLFSSMSECFGKNLCEQFIGLELLSLGEDVSFKVRKEAIKQLPIIGKLVSKPFFSRLFTFYQAKARDGSNWAIRKACIDIILEVASLCLPEEREGPLTDTYLLLLKDNNKWVKISAYKHLGPYIHQVKNKLNPELFKEFCRMADNDINGLSKENEIIYACAYNFPAVLDAVGPERWESDLWKVYEKLLKSNDKRLRITLSESLHEIAKLLGESLTEKYLFRVVDMFFRDKSDEIKLGVIKHMSSIMKVLSEQKRESLIGVFEEFQKDQKKWRIRESIGKQLGQILEIYKPQLIFEYVVPILLKFCSDTVSTVREEAARKVADFIEKLSEEEGLMIGLIESVKAFGTSPKYTQRQEYHCC
jgi:serine/threonine-protein phosphatase 4 regulatory subunit 1